MIERWEEIPVKLDRVRKESFFDMKCSNNYIYRARCPAKTNMLSYILQIHYAFRFKDVLFDSKVRSRSIGSLPKIGISFRIRKKPVIFSDKTILSPVDKKSFDKDDSIKISKLFTDEQSSSSAENIIENKSDFEKTKQDR